MAAVEIPVIGSNWHIIDKGTQNGMGFTGIVRSQSTMGMCDWPPSDWFLYIGCLTPGRIGEQNNGPNDSCFEH